MLDKPAVGQPQLFTVIDSSGKMALEQRLSPPLTSRNGGRCHNCCERAYLVYLGVMLWRAPVSTDTTPPLGTAAAFRQAYVVTALNPKGIAFFVAFVLQFMAPSSPFLPQAAILVASFVTMATAPHYSGRRWLGAYSRWCFAPPCDAGSTAPAVAYWWAREWRSP